MCWYPKGKDPQIEGKIHTGMSSPSRLHFISTGCCQKGQINTKNCAKPRAFWLYSSKGMQLNLTCFGKHPWGERSSWGCKMILPGGMGKVSWLEKAWKCFPVHHTLLQSATEPLEPLTPFPVQLPWLAPAGIPPARHPCRTWTPGSAPGWVWVIPHAIPCHTKFCFLPFHHHHFYFANFQWLFPSFFMPHQQLEFLVELILGWKKAKKTKKRKMPPPGAGVVGAPRLTSSCCNYI